MILVTGATGTIGSELVKQLQASGAPFKVAASSPEQVENAHADCEDYIFGCEHRASEKRIEVSGIPYTFLRANSFMQNFVNEYGQSIRVQGAFFLPQADARVSHIDVRDIAAVATKALNERS